MLLVTFGIVLLHDFDIGAKVDETAGEAIDELAD